MTSLAITDVRIFTGTDLTPPRTIVVADGLITDGSGAAVSVDGRGGVLIPGLIDTHVHLAGPGTVDAFSRHGVTTVLDMGAFDPALIDPFRGGAGRTDVRSSLVGATVAGSRHSHIPGRPPGGLVDGADDADRWVADRVADGADYIKVIADVPGPDQATLDGVVRAAHERDRRVIAHASIVAAVRMAQAAGVDVLTHVPMDGLLDDDDVRRVVADGRVVVPTLVMMQGVADRTGLPDGYARARRNLAALHRAGVPVVAGTDANQAPGIPFSPGFGTSLHDELELLVDAGLTPLDALRAATVLAAEHFDLPDRGVIAPGRRADLVLLAGNPLDDITATRTIERVWIGGVELSGSAGPAGSGR